MEEILLGGRGESASGQDRSAGNGCGIYGRFLAVTVGCYVLDQVSADIILSTVVEDTESEQGKFYHVWAGTDCV